MEKTKQVGWKTTVGLHKCIKLEAAKQGCTMADIIELAVRQYLQRQERRRDNA